jgi:dihydroorotase
MWTIDWQRTYPRECMKLPQALSFAVLVLVGTASAQPQYDLLLRGGHVIDSKNKISEIRDVAIRGGKIAAVESKIDPATALKTVDVSGLHVTPGL